MKRASQTIISIYLLIGVLWPSIGVSQSQINEFNYQNSANKRLEYKWFGLASGTRLIHLYDVNGLLYQTIDFAEAISFNTGQDEVGRFVDYYVFSVPNIQSNGGMAVVIDGTFVEEFWSYGQAVNLTAVDGPASGSTANYISASLAPDDPSNASIQSVFGNWYRSQETFGGTNAISCPSADTTYIDVELCSGYEYDCGFYIIVTDDQCIRSLVGSDGCDSTVITNVHFIHRDTTFFLEEICTGETFDFYGDILDSTDIYHKVLSDQEGCDSVIQLDLTLEEHEAYVVLQEFYQAMNGPNWNANAGWEESCDPCSWFGVTCNVDGEVTQLNLVANNLTGVLPATLSSITSLLHLNLSNNFISGPVPDFSGLTNLLSLDLSKNQLAGNIPASVGSLSSLELLSLSQNLLAGELPAELFNLLQLVSLDLSKNTFTGSLPSLIGQLANLQSLNLGTNNFTGLLPAEIGEISTLTEVNIEKNDFGSPYPPTITNLCNQAQLLDFSQNNFFCDIDDFCAGNCQECIEIGKFGRFPAGSCFTWERDGQPDPLTDPTREICVGDMSVYKVTVSNGDGNILSECEYRFDEGCMAMVEIEATSSYISGGETITLDAGPGFKKYQWSTGAKTQTIQVNQPGEYSVVVTEQGNCVAADLINIVEGGTRDLGSILVNACANEQVTLSAPIRGTSYDWSTGGSTSTISVTANPGVHLYNLVIQDEDGCDTRVTFLVIGSFLEVDIDASRGAICPGETVILTALTTGNVSYQWSKDGQNLGTANSSEITEAGTYQVLVTSVNGSCTATDMIVINKGVAPDLVISPVAETVCVGEQVQIYLNGGDSYSWQAGSISGQSNPIEDYPLSNTIYHVTATDAFGCNATGVLSITVKELPEVDAGPDLEVCEGEEISISLSGNTDNYDWLNKEENAIFHTGEELTFLPEEAFTLLIRAELNGCFAEDESSISILNSSDPETIKNYMIANGFFELPIMIHGPVGVNARSGGLVVDHAAQIIAIENDIVAPADELQNFFQNEIFTTTGSNGFVTKNNNFCVSGQNDLINEIEADFSSSNFGYWVHLWEDPDLAQDLLYIKCKLPGESKFGPTGADHLEFIQGDIDLLKSGQIGAGTSIGNQIFGQLLFDLPDLYVASYDELLQIVANPVYGCGTSQAANFISPAGVALRLPSQSGVIFRDNPKYSSILPLGALLAFNRSESGTFAAYRGFVRDGNFGGYLNALSPGSSNENIYASSHYGFDQVPADAPSDVLLGITIGSNDLISLETFTPNGTRLNQTGVGPFVSDLSETGSFSNPILLNPVAIVDNELQPLDDLLVRVDQLLVNNVDLFVDVKGDGLGGILHRVTNQITNEIDWIYGYYDYGNTEELTYLRWNLTLCRWEFFDPDRTPEFDPLLFVTGEIWNQVIFALTDGKHEVLAALSMVPLFEVVPLPDLLDAIFYFLEGETTEGFLSLAATIPSVSWVRGPLNFIPRIQGKDATLIRFIDNYPIVYSERLKELFTHFDFSEIQAEKFDQWLRTNDDALSSLFLHEGDGIFSINDRFAEAFKRLADTYTDLNAAQELFDPAIINKMADLMAKPSFISAIGGSSDDLAQIVRNNIFAPCNGCTGTKSFLKPLVDYLDDVEFLTGNYQNTPGFQTVVESVKNGASPTIDGAAHMLNQLRVLDPATVTRMEANILDADNFEGICTNCLFDIEIEDAFDGLKKLELKSYSVGTISGISGSPQFINQFKAYLAGATNLDEFEYIFNGRKTMDLGLIKMNFRILFTNEASSLLATFGESKFLELFGVDNVDDFITDVISDLESPVYNFIKIE